jgi:hypothetical protein
MKFLVVFLTFLIASCFCYNYAPRICTTDAVCMDGSWANQLACVDDTVRPLSWWANVPAPSFLGGMGSGFISVSYDGVRISSNRMETADALLHVLNCARRLNQTLPHARMN